MIRIRYDGRSVDVMHWISGVDYTLPLRSLAASYGGGIRSLSRADYHIAVYDGAAVLLRDAAESEYSFTTTASR